MSAAGDLHDELADDVRLAGAARLAAHCMTEIGAGEDDAPALLKLLELLEERLAARRDRLGELLHDLPVGDGRAS